MIKKIVNWLITLGTGYLIGTCFLLSFFSIFYLLSAFQILPFQNLIYEPWYTSLYNIVSLTTIIGFIVYFFYSRRQKNQFYEIFSPTKNKLLATVGVFVSLAAWSYVYWRQQFTIVNSLNFSFTDSRVNPLLTLIAIFFTFILFYPFSAVLWSLIESGNKKDKKKKLNKLLFILLLIALNPFSLVMGRLFLFMADYNRALQTNTLTECGAVIQQVNTGGAAEAAGMKPLQIVTSLNGTPIQTAQQLVTFFSGLESSQPVNVTVITEANVHNVYTVIPQRDEQTGKYKLGAGVGQGYCKKE